MKKKDLIDLKNKSQKDLETKVNELRKEVVTLALESKLEKVKNLHETRNKRKEIAQVLTFLELKNVEDQIEPVKKLVSKVEEKQLNSKKEDKNVTK